MLVFLEENNCKGIYIFQTSKFGKNWVWENYFNQYQTRHYFLKIVGQKEGTK